MQFFDSLILIKNRVIRWGRDSNPYKFANYIIGLTAGERMAALPPHPTLTGFATLNLSIK